ncbi:MAG: radical SAM family heme chaperone HemW [Pseudomonadota bacterium]
MDGNPAPARDRSVTEPPSFGIYVHWPFCKSKCPYCDFNSHVRERIDETAWTAALTTALDRQAAALPGRIVSSIFFGGGTPSLMAPATVAAVLARIAAHWTIAPDAEITLEANPTSVEAARFRDLAAAGVNRLSLGIQALDDQALRFLGRQHDGAEARAAIALAQRHFARFSFDLIYARPGQTRAAWRRELAEALALAGDHLSLYQLTIEAGTAFHAAHARGDFLLPDADAAAALYELTGELLAQHGLAAYEISNYARPGAESRHNLVYWTYGDYVGVGPGAHGRVTLGDRKLATRQAKAPETWLAEIAAGGDGMAETEPLDRADRLTELTMMGLRLAAGIPRARFRRELDAEPETLFDAKILGWLIEAELLTLDEQALRATAAGRQRLNAVLAKLLA